MRIRLLVPFLLAIVAATAFAQPKKENTMPSVFTVPADAARFATNPESTITHQRLRLRTGADGLARIYLRRPAHASP